MGTPMVADDREGPVAVVIEFLSFMGLLIEQTIGLVDGLAKLEL